MDFSSRSKVPRSGIREIMELSSQYEDVIHLEIGEPNADTPEHIKKAAKLAIDNGFTHYTPNQGLLSLREAISRHLQSRYKKAITADEIVVTPGAVTALAISLLALVDEGEKVLIPDPGWPNYEQMIMSQGAIPVRYPLDETFSPDIERIKALIDEDTKGVIVNTPSNPTGRVLSEKQIREMIDVCSTNNLFLLSDEVYDGIVFDRQHLSPLSFNYPNTISVFSFSKSYAMTGWRVGYAVVHKQMSPILNKLLETTVACTSSISQMAAEAAISSSQEFVENMRELYKTRRDKVIQILEDENIDFVKPEGAFYILLNTGMDGNDFAKMAIEKEKVAVAPGNTFGPSTRNFVRISLATAEEELLEGVKRLVRLIKH